MKYNGYALIFAKTSWQPERKSVIVCEHPSGWGGALPRDGREAARCRARQPEWEEVGSAAVDRPLRSSVGCEGKKVLRAVGDF